MLGMHDNPKYFIRTLPYMRDKNYLVFYSIKGDEKEAFEE